MDSGAALVIASIATSRMARFCVWNTDSIAAR